MKKLMISIMLLLIFPAAALSSESEPTGEAARPSLASSWAAESIYTAEKTGILISVGEYPDYTLPITREQLCVLAVRAYELAGNEPETAEDNPFNDTLNPSVAAAFRMGIVNGRGDGSFDPDGTVTRQEAAKIFSSLAELLGVEPQGEEVMFSDEATVDSWAEPYVAEASAYGYFTADYKGDFLPREALTAEQAAAVLVRLYKDVFPSETYSVSYDDRLAEKPIPAAEAETPVPLPESSCVKTGGYVYDGTYKKNDRSQVFTEGEITSQAEAEAQMTQITVNIWELKNGEKVPSTMTLTVHKNIADIVTEVFEEIFNGSEKFPIDKDSTHCYSFRNRNGRLSEHSTGTAVDINPDQNYCVYSDGTVVGSLYAPGENPYSIVKYGDCWNAFVSHGFTWGGDAWRSTKDYMHFSYLGT